MSKKHGVVRDMESDNLDLMDDDLFELTPEELDDLDEVKEQVELNLFTLTHNYGY